MMLGMIDDPTKILREHGVQVTAQRLAVLRAVSRCPHSTTDVGYEWELTKSPAGAN
jgi:Fe2+ or Zn2+ uptake regulation protein